MADKKIIAVAGATGAQGGGLVRAILADKDGPFRARALTRDAGSDKARALAAAGAEVVAANVDDEASVRAAFDGAYGAFCVTFFWDHMSPERELTQATNLARAARDAGVQHVIWSTLEDVRRFVPLDDPRMPTLQGKYKVPHFDAKGEADQVFRDLGVPTTFLLTSFYWDNLIYFGMQPRRGADGVLTLTLPMADKKLPGVAAEDIGRTAYGIFKRGPGTIGQTLSACGGHPTGAEMAATLTKVFGEEVRYTPVSPEVYRGLGFPGADDVGNMFQFKAEFEKEYCARRPLDVTRRLNPEVQSFEEWARANKDRIPRE
jgi:uncharacterized protein YbjT (DUF2867 family)